MDKKSKDLFKHELGTGTWSWGDRFLWGFGKDYGEEDVHSVFDEALKSGITLFDTAEFYGTGESERLLGKFAAGSPQPIFIATKFMPLPWRMTRVSMRHALYGSLKRLGVSQIDLYQINHPTLPVQPSVWIEESAAMKQEGLIGSIGVSNFTQHQIENAIQVLNKYGLKLASVQVEYNLLNRAIEKNGLLNFCKTEKIRVIAYSPLAQGLLTGKYSLINPPSGVRHTRFHTQLQSIGPLITALRKLADERGVQTPAAIALNWAMRKGALPIPGAKTMVQLIQNTSALGWKLNEDEIAYLDDVSDSC